LACDGVSNVIEGFCGASYYVLASIYDARYSAADNVSGGIENIREALCKAVKEAFWVTCGNYGGGAVNTSNESDHVAR
jgi:hypothetical protein